MPRSRRLAGLQDRVKERTQEFDQRCPDRANLTPEQLAELRDLENEQTRIREEFHLLMNPNANQEKGDGP